MSDYVTHPYDAEDEEIRKAFAEKDAEIEKLKGINIGLVAQDRGFREEIERLKAEVRENTSVMFAMGSTIESRNVLIGELANALAIHLPNDVREIMLRPSMYRDCDLKVAEKVQRAREVVGKR